MQLDERLSARVLELVQISDYKLVRLILTWEFFT